MTRLPRLAIFVTVGALALGRLLARGRARQ